MAAHGAPGETKPLTTQTPGGGQQPRRRPQDDGPTFFSLHRGRRGTHATTFFRGHGLGSAVTHFPAGARARVCARRGPVPPFTGHTFFGAGGRPYISHPETGTWARRPDVARPPETLVRAPDSVFFCESGCRANVCRTWARRPDLRKCWGVAPFGGYAGPPVQHCLPHNRKGGTLPQLHLGPKSGRRPHVCSAPGNGAASPDHET